MTQYQSHWSHGQQDVTYLTTCGQFYENQNNWKLFLIKNITCCTAGSMLILFMLLTPAAGWGRSIWSYVPLETKFHLDMISLCPVYLSVFTILHYLLLCVLWPGCCNTTAHFHFHLVIGLSLQLSSVTNVTILTNKWYF